MRTESEWFMLGHRVIFALPPDASRVSPRGDELKSAALGMGISLCSAKTALAVFNGETVSPEHQPPKAYPLVDTRA